MDQPGAPPLPCRHPARRPGNMSMDSNNSKTISQQYLHIWEHSVTLYHGFDWQAAAENFLYLSRMIDRNLESTMCLLNAAIIFARLGEYSTASGILADAEPAGETMAITMFVWGHVEFELGNFEKAEDSFKVAMNSLNGRSQSYNHLGLDFTLKASHIAQDLRVFASRNNLYGFLGTLGALPADSIFNSPSASGSSLRISAPQSTLQTRESTDSSYVPSLRDSSTPTSPTISPVEGYFEHDKSGIWGQAGQQSQKKDVRVLVRHDSNSLSEALEDVRAGFADLQMPPKLPEFPASTEQPQPPPRVSLPPTPSPSIRDEGRKRIGAFARRSSNRPTEHIVTQDVDHSRHPALRARDARVHGGETGQLASFILNLPPQNQRKPREAVISQESSTRDLASFLRDDRPPTPVSPLADDPSVYSDDGQDAVSEIHSIHDQEVGRFIRAINNDDHAVDDNSTVMPPAPQEPLAPATALRRKFRDGMASFIISRPSSIHISSQHHQHSASTSAVDTPASLTALPKVSTSTRTSSLKISPLTPVKRKLAKKDKDQQEQRSVAAAARMPKPPKQQPKMVPVEQPNSYAEFFPTWMTNHWSK